MQNIKPDLNVKKFNISKVLDLFQWFIVLLLLLISAALVLSNFNNPLKLRVFSVNSGSMEPAIHLGSLVFVRPFTNYSQGDVITFTDRGNTKQTTTHRILSVKTDLDPNIPMFETKGDANEDKDTNLVSLNRVVGKVIFSIPLIGYIVAFAKTQLGFTFLIVIPATLLIFSELKNIKDEVVGAFFDRKQANTAATVKITEIKEEVVVLTENVEKNPKPKKTKTNKEKEEISKSNIKKHKPVSTIKHTKNDK